ncbi:MAG: menaquinone biosynthesis protein [Thermodesulfovibrionales bacterium]|nr:menaquinone biosynthesis protein [Thermodesulfovibrionales bacterium]
MAEHKLKIGKIPYANLFPIFYMLEKECDCSNYEFIEGVPSSVNLMLRDGKVDVSSSSSIEYLRNRDKYTFIEGHSISSIGPVGSIILFSRKTIEALDGHTILTSSQSATSVALLEIILTKSFKVKCNLKPAKLAQGSVPSGIEAYLLIGDDALRTKKAFTITPSLTLPPRGGGQGWGGDSKLQILNLGFTYIYDLGELWHKYTGLPFTFALWIYKKDCCKEKMELLEKFKDDLNKARKLALKNFKEIASKSPLRNVLTEDELIAYWKNVSYAFGAEHKKGFELFRKLSEELGLI